MFSLCIIDTGFIIIELISSLVMLCGGCYDWQNNSELFSQICGKVTLIGQNCKVMQNTWGLVEFSLIIANMTSHYPGLTADFTDSVTYCKNIT